MTIDEAIKHCLEVAEKNENDVEVYEVLAKNHENTYSKLTATKYAADCDECAADHRQLAEWLKELKELREEKEIALSVRTGAKAKYNYTDEQVTAYWQGVEDCAKDTIDKRQKCDLDILRGINGVAVGINNYRVTDGKIYGMLVTEGHFKLNCYDVIHAICKEHSAAEALKLLGGETDEHS